MFIYLYKIQKYCSDIKLIEMFRQIKVSGYKGGLLFTFLLTFISLLVPDFLICDSATVTVEFPWYKINKVLLNALHFYIKLMSEL